MAYEEAIELIRSTPLYRHDKENGKQSDLFKALDLAIEALNKQMPKKPVFKSSATTECAECDTCIFISDKFCPRCGQAILWEK